MTVSFLNHHYFRFMDAVTDGRVTRLSCEDLRFPINKHDRRGATAVYCIINDLDPDEGIIKGMLKEYEDY